MSLGGRIVIGIALVLAGLLFFAANFGLITSEVLRTVISFWPILLVAWGLTTIYHRDDNGDTISGSILIIVGLLFLGNRFQLFNFGWNEFWKVFWPIALILLGWSMLSNRSKTEGQNVAFLGGLEKTSGQWVLKSEAYQAILGGIELDLSQAVFSSNEINLDLTALLGGIDLKVPDGVTVNCKGTAALGGIDFFGKSQGGILSFCDKARPADNERILNIHCRVLMGGIEITRSN